MVSRASVASSVLSLLPTFSCLKLYAHALNIGGKAVALAVVGGLHIVAINLAPEFSDFLVVALQGGIVLVGFLAKDRGLQRGMRVGWIWRIFPARDLRL